MSSVSSVSSVSSRGAALLGVRQVVPMHYGTFPVLIGTPEALRAHLDPRIGLLVLSPGQTAS